MARQTDDTEPKVVNTMLITVNDESEPDDTPDKRPDTQVEVQIFDDEDAASSVFRTLTETKFHGQYESTHVRCPACTHVPAAVCRGPLAAWRR